MINVYKPQSPRFQDLTGKTFNSIKVIGHSHIKRYGKKPYHFWECECVCGKRIIVIGEVLKQSSYKSCGCLKNSLIRKAKTKHGHAIRKTSEYASWLGMRSRCADLNDVDYGGRGIKVCSRWANSFENFLADMGLKPLGRRISIERMDNEGNYKPSNCKWATPKEQAQNTRRVHNAKGYAFIKAHRRWLAYYNIGDGQRRIGYFLTEAAAKEAVKLQKALHPFTSRGKNE